MKTCRLSDAVLPEPGSDAGKVVLIDKLYVVGEKTRFKKIDGDYAERLAEELLRVIRKGISIREVGLVEKLQSNGPVIGVRGQRAHHLHRWHAVEKPDAVLPIQYLIVFHNSVQIRERGEDDGPHPLIR
jgi:septum formation topological specificity factor MinE